MLYRILLLSLIGFFPMVSAAQEATPNHVFQRVAAINDELAAIHSANFTTSGQANRETAQRMPRHVLKLADVLHKRVQLLRFINGLDPNKAPEFRVAEVRPANVKAMMDLIFEDLISLHGAYGIADHEHEIPLPSGKTPTDVYNELLMALASIDGLGLPETTANDVNQVANTIVGDLEKLHIHLLGTKIPRRPFVNNGKTPRDAYNAAYDALEELQALSVAHPEYNINGGVVLPDQMIGEVTPADVRLLLVSLRAEVFALKVSVGLGVPTKDAPMVGGSTPTSVVVTLEHARQLIHEISEGKG